VYGATGSACFFFLPPNQEKVATLFFPQEHAVFILQMARKNCPETPVTNTNLRHVISEKIENLKPAPFALPGSTFGKSQSSV